MPEPTPAAPRSRKQRKRAEARRWRAEQRAGIAAAGSEQTWAARVVRRERFFHAVGFTTVGLTAVVVVAGHVWRQDAVALAGAVLPTPVLMWLGYACLPLMAAGVLLLRAAVPRRYERLRALLVWGALTPLWPLVAVLPSRRDQSFELDASVALGPELADAYLAGYAAAAVLFLSALVLVPMLAGLAPPRRTHGVVGAALVPVVLLTTFWVSGRAALQDADERLLQAVAEQVPQQVEGEADAAPASVVDCDRFLDDPEGCVGAVLGGVEEDTEVVGWTATLFGTPAEAGAAERVYVRRGRDGVRVVRTGRFVVELEPDPDDATVEAVVRAVEAVRAPT